MASRSAIVQIAGRFQELTTGDILSIPGLSISTAVGKIIPGATSISLRNHADSADNLLITDAGAATVRLTLAVGASTGTGGIVNAGSTAAGTQALTLYNSDTSGTRYLAYFGTEATFTARGAIVYSGSGFGFTESSGTYGLFCNSNGGLTCFSTLDNPFRLQAATANEAVYQSWYTSATVRRGYFGWGSSSSSNMSLINEENGTLVIATNNGSNDISISTGHVVTAGTELTSPLLTTTASSSTGTAVIIDASNRLRPLTSSERHKKNIRRRYKIKPKQLASFLDLSPIKFDYRESKIKNILGFSAEEIDAAGLTEMLNYDNEKKPYSLREHAMLAYIHTVLKQQDARIRVLERWK